MSRPIPTAADLVAEASLPCHHQREPFGPCETCLEDVIATFIDGLVPEGELTIANANIEELEAGRRNDEGLIGAMEEKFEKLKGRFETARQEIGEELAKVRSDALDKMTKLIEEAEEPQETN